MLKVRVDRQMSFSLLRNALENFDVGIKMVEIRLDGVFPVSPQQDVAQETIDNDDMFDDVEEKVKFRHHGQEISYRDYKYRGLKYSTPAFQPDNRLSIPRSALDKLLAATDDCVASLRDSESDLVAKFQHVQASIVNENGLPRAGAKSIGEHYVVSAKTKEIAERFSELKLKVEAFMPDVSRDVSLELDDYPSSKL